MYIAHKREDGQIQLLSEHLKGTAQRAAEFAHAFGAEKMACRAGLLHDIGKYSIAGQMRMNDPEHMKKVDHASAGAQTAMRLFRDVPAAFAVAGHHGGLQDQGTAADGRDEPTLCGRLKKALDGRMDYSAWASEVTAQQGSMVPSWLDQRNAFQMQFYIRMLFSCLVDADYLDTEEFMKNNPPVRGGGDSLKALHERLKRYVQPWLNCAETTLNEKRNEILRRCLQGAEDERGMYTLTVPTGGGKTVSSLSFALSHAAGHSLKRIVYVIPYTSIIEQNAEVFAKILGEDNVLEHHSNVDFEEDENDDENEINKRRRAAAENWDAPIVVTTAVQFFESLYAARPSRCRKLHNLAESVIVFDEAQMLPIEYLRPCAAAISELVQHYGVTAVLCTATQPSLDHLIHEFSPGLKIREICPRRDEMQECFRRVHIEWEGELNSEVLAELVGRERQCLCIVNTRKLARRIYEMLPEESRFHLSTLMTPEHRSRVLSDIRRCLRDNEACHVAATSLIEAGVDVDFPQVWREEAGLDSILQAAGRCNREGKRAKEESSVHVFKAADNVLWRIKPNIQSMRSVREGKSPPDSYEAIQIYFDRLHNLYGKDRMDSRSILELCKEFAFRTIEDKFRMIDTETVTVYIPSEKNKELLKELRTGMVSRDLLRKLGRSGVNVYRDQILAMCRAGKVEECDGFYILKDETAYSMKCGLSTEIDMGAIRESADQ